ncbi:hypothetical protein [Aquabacter sp. CN5-332]|uniref:hypothetical protein n=1 Tax=Aquabacter sp. CN5-332 TaxID=3156608 RepID=UPI0032B33A9D
MQMGTDDVEKLLRLSRMGEREWERLKDVVGLSDEEWALAKRGIAATRMVSTAGALMRGAAYALFAGAAAFALFGEHLNKIKAFFMGAPK